MSAVGKRQTELYINIGWNYVAIKLRIFNNEENAYDSMFKCVFVWVYKNIFVVTYRYSSGCRCFHYLSLEICENEVGSLDSGIMDYGKNSYFYIFYDEQIVI